MNRRVHVVVSGRVQGVSYRMNAKKKAASLGLSGWVKNRPDGNVEALAEGTAEALEDFIAWCWIGPSAARVKDVAASWHEATGEFSGFEVAY